MDKNIFSKRIVIYGTGNTGRLFFEKYKDELNIYACTNSEKEVESFDSRIQPISYQDIDIKKDLLVVCSIYYEEIRRILLLDGLKPYIDFIKWDIFEELYRHLKYNNQLMVLVGQCEINEIRTVLSQIPSAVSAYSIIYFDERKVCSHGDKFSLEDYYDCQGVLCLADIFVQPAVFSEQSVKGFGILHNQLKSRCRIFKISLFDFDSYWAQDIDKRRSLSKFYMTVPNKKLSAYANRDQCVETMVEAGIPVKKILTRIKDTTFFEKDTVIKNHNKTIKRADLTDRVSDVKISDFIIDMYKKEKLFRDRGHFNQILLYEYVKRFLWKLGILADDKEVQRVDTDFLFEGVNELPIYPSTAAWLKLEWVDKTTKYRMINYKGIRDVTFDVYMEELILYYKSVYELLKMC